MSPRPLRKRLYWGCMGLIALLYLISVPWYRDFDAPLRLWFGLPDWVAVALFCYVGIAVLNAVAWSVTEVRDASVESQDPEAT